MHDVIVAGDANTDIIVPYPRFLNKERTRVKYPEPEIHGGGTCANTAVALSRLGMDTTFIGTIGDDQYGHFIQRDFEDAGVDDSGLVVDASLNTVGVFAFVDERGERYLWGWPRVDRSFTVLDESKVDFNAFNGARWLHTSGMMLTYDTSARQTIIDIMKAAHERGIATSLDLNLRVDDGVLDPGFAAALQRIMPYVTYLLGSGPEEFSYLGDQDWQANAAALAVDGRVVVARDGCHGSVAFTDGKRIDSPAYHVEVEDTIGAGDVFNAGFIAALLNGRNLQRALQAGNAVSGYKVARKGARSTPNLTQLEDFMAATHASVAEEGKAS
ncbi:sugar kinase [Bifidobacterium sp. ESL0690]|uniref:carbohydrate kinase family protein n=1 Tax=Bifidobacterium sp. ESL0690 TaxID=2983214 RepID=UPI0023FA36B8|nr:sugar kinase [Bifidobacterium sp. ESL0690]WEV46331.1 sugar kinase [Bifidobacterium sp. ESL0690]